MAGTPGLFSRNVNKPKCVDIPGKVLEGQSHPGWLWLGQNRDSSGRLMPYLLKAYNGGKMPAHIGVVGFSAGSNAGVREFLRHQEDRAMIDFVFMIDGLHPAIKDNGELAFPDQHFIPFLRYAEQASLGNGVMTITASNVAAPLTSPKVMATKDAASMMYRNVKASAPSTGSIDPLIRVNSWGDPRHNESFVNGNCYGMVFPGNTKEDHIAQARVVLPRVLDAFLPKALGYGDAPTA